MKNTDIYTDTGRDKGRDWTMITEKTIQNLLVIIYNYNLELAVT